MTFVVVIAAGHKIYCRGGKLLSAHIDRQTHASKLRKVETQMKPLKEQSPMG